ncbi:dynamin protein dnm1 [Moniliophthora roreri]|nr:dynamin protein dnm1 [Moniliophthora roreri]
MPKYEVMSDRMRLVSISSRSLFISYAGFVLSRFLLPDINPDDIAASAPVKSLPVGTIPIAWLLLDEWWCC